MQSHSQQVIENSIRNIWHRLSDEEIESRKERRDEFFLAIRKKHGVARAQAEMLLLDLEHKFYEAAA